MGETALYQAVETEKILQVETLLKFGADPNLPRNDGWAPLHAAVLKQNLSLIEILLKADANPNLKNNIFAQTPVHFAIKNSVKPAILLLLVQFKGSLSTRDKYNKRPLDYAETEEMKEAISKLKMEREDIFFTPQKERVMSFQSNTRGNNNLSIQNTNTFETGLGFTLNPNNIESFVTQNTNVEYNTNQNNQNNQNNQTIQAINRTPVKHTTNYIYVIKSSEKKLHYKSSRKKARQIETETEIKETESDQKTKEIKNHEFSPSDKNVPVGMNYNTANTHNTHQDRENLNFDKFSFVTKEGVVLSKLISSRDEGGLSDINPIDTISNYNTTHNPLITVNSNNNVTPLNKNELRKEDYSHLIIHNTSGNKSSQVHITATDENESDIEVDECQDEDEGHGYLDSLENRQMNTDRAGRSEREFDIEDVQINEDQESEAEMKVMETVVRNNEYLKENGTSSCQDFKSDEESMSMSISACRSQMSHAPTVLKKEKNINDNYRITEVNCDEEKSYASNLKTHKSSIVQEISPEQDDFELTPSKTSYIISDLPVTSVKKSDNEDPYRTIKKRLDYDNIGEKNSFNQININANPNSSVISKIHYHKESKSLNNSNLTHSHTTFSNAVQNQNNNLNHNQQEAEMNPRYKTRTAFQLPYMPKLRKNLSPEVMRKINYSEQENFLSVEDERPFNTQANITMNRVRSGNNSTRNNSTRYNTSYEDNFISNRIGRKKIYLQEQVNPHDTSNKTIIHHGERELLTTQGNSNMFNTNYSRYNNDNQMTYTPGHCVTCHNCNTNVKKVSTLTEFSRRGSPVSNRHNHILDTVYCQTDTNRSAISTKDAKKLHDWLNNIGMQNYYNNFLEKGIFNIDRVIESMLDIRTRMSFKDFEEMGVRKPGHIYRMLLQLEVDAKMIDDTVYNLLFGYKLNKSNENSLERSNFRCNLKISSEKFVCCGILPKSRVDVSNGENKFNNQFANDNSAPYLSYDLITWLKTINMPNLRKHFIHNGFDSMEYFILQMFSMNPIDDAFLEDNLHIYSTKERRVILSQLAKEVKMINNRLYCNSNMNSFVYDDTDRMKFEKENVEEGCKMCLIF
jgi:hypothetical protein